MDRYLPQSLMVLFSIILIIIIPYQINVTSSTILNARLLPMLLGISILILSLLSLIPWRKLYKSSLVKTETKEKSNIPYKKHYFKILLIFIDIVLWIVLASIIGFILATTLVLFVCALTAGYNRLLMASVFSLFFSILLYFLFVALLNVSLPTLPIFL